MNCSFDKVKYNEISWVNSFNPFVSKYIGWDGSIGLNYTIGVGTFLILLLDGEGRRVGGKIFSFSILKSGKL